jgi:molecular chaperone DnaK
MVKEAEQFAEEDKKRRASAEAKNNAESLIHTTERQLAEFGDKVEPAVKSEIETAIAEAKTAVESDDPDQMTEKTNALAQAAMKLGEAMYKAQQAETEAAAGADSGTSGPAEGQAAEEDVVDAEFSEVDDENKSS